MPTSEPMSLGEISRNLIRISETLVGLDTKLNAQLDALRSEISDVRHRAQNLESSRQTSLVYLEQFKEFREQVKADFDRIDKRLERQFDQHNTRIEALEADMDKRAGSKTLLLSVWSVAGIAVVNLIWNLVQANLLHP